MNSDGKAFSPSRARRLVLGVVAVAVAGCVVGWSANAIFAGPPDVEGATAYTYVTVNEGEVGSSIELSTIAEWAPEPVGSNLASGSVTTVDVDPGQSVTPGTVLYTVNLRPVVVAVGQIPSFRNLAQGANGPDVAQLQGMLSSLRLFTGATDGKFGPGTTAAVKTWQRGFGRAPDGVVLREDVIFVPTLPVRIVLDTSKITRGAMLSGGELVLSSLPESPKYTVPVTAIQATLMPPGTRVEITSPTGETWLAEVLDQTTSDQAVSVNLAGVGGTAICADSCDEIRAVGPTSLESQIITVETTTGLSVPSGALLSDAQNRISVIDARGARIPVKVLTSARGMSIITGVESGTRVRLPATSTE
jgi:peptidoglycan hydrolase-like protein with peptidoglycan-binding domain